jgi:hypothetical protein
MQMQTQLTLPNNSEHRAKLIRNHVQRERHNNAYWRAITTLALYYSLGFRAFTTFDPITGEVRPVFYDKDDAGLEYFSNTILFEIQEIVGQLTSRNMMPHVERVGSSLEAIRERGSAQALLDSTVSEENVAQAQKSWAWKAATYGLAGLSGAVYDHPAVGLVSGVECVDGSEILPFPSGGKDLAGVRGTIRNRVVPLDWLKGVYGARKINAALKSKKLSRATIQFGEPLTVDKFEGNGSRVGTHYLDGTTPDNKSQAQDVVELNELWIVGPSGTVTEYCVTSGEHEFEYADLRTASMYPTLQVERFYENGSFYGCGHFFMRYGSHRAAERMLQRLFKNVRQQDQYQITVLPQGDYNEDSAFTDHGEGLKFLKLRPDPLSENFRPFSIPVPNANELPLNAIAAAQAEGDRVNPVPDLVEQKGRIDSAAGLEALEASSRKAITNPEQAMVRAFSGCWRSVAQQVTTSLLEEPRKMPVKRLSLDLLGTVIGEDDTIEFTDRINPLPNIRHLKFSVQEANPRSAAAKKAEAREMLDAGLNTPDEYKLFLLSEGIEMSGWAEPHRSIYQRTVRNILTLYGDGEVPGQIVTTADTTRPDLELTILTPILLSEAMTKSSVQVQNEFAAWKQYLEAAQGFALPQGVPTFDELSMGPSLQQGLGQAAQQIVQ